MKGGAAAEDEDADMADQRELEGRAACVLLECVCVGVCVCDEGWCCCRR